MAERFRRAVDERAIAVRDLVSVTKPADFEVEKARVTEAHARVGQRMNQLKDMMSKATDVSEKRRKPSQRAKRAASHAAIC